jgi:predicted phage terminase large subunit-like protein
MMEPTDPADKKFMRAWLKYYTREIHRKFGFVFFLTVDPASRQRKKSDFTAMLVFAVDKDWNFYLVDGIHDKLNPAQRIDAVFRLVKKWGIQIVGYETIGFQETDKFYIDRKMAADNFYFQIVEITNHKLNKDARIEGLQPIMQNGHFHLPQAPMPYKREWENPDDGQGTVVDIKEEWLREMDHWPNSAHDDLLDAGTMAREIVYAGYIPEAMLAVPEDADYNAGGVYASADEERSPLV